MTTVHRRKDVQRSGRLALGLISPTVLVLGLVVGYPIVSAIRESLYERGQGLDSQGFVVQGDKFVGLSHYRDILSGPGAAAFRNAFWYTSFFTVTTVVIETVIGVVMALVMHLAFRGRGLVRASILVPWAIPTAVSGLLWRWVFQADGIANAIIGRQVLWTTEGFHAKVAVIISDTWKTAPFIGLLVLAGLQLIPQEVYEAARVDGAGAIARFRYVTVPALRPYLVFVVVAGMIQAIQIFDQAYVVSGGTVLGSPAGATSTLVVFIYQEAFRLNALGYGSAAAVVLLVIVFAGTLLTRRLLPEERSA